MMVSFQILAQQCEANIAFEARDSGSSVSYCCVERLHETGGPGLPDRSPLESVL